MQKRWIFRQGDPALRERLARELGISSLLAQIVVNRGIRDRDEADAFLWPKLNRLHDPMSLPDMEKAARRIRKAIESRQKITIYGDYDVDGTTGSAVLLKFFQQLGYPVESYIPHRVEEGYGLNLGAASELRSAGTQLMITVDCGATAHEVIAYLQQAGVDVIVTDHHDMSEELPAAFAVINPKRPGCDYPFPLLAGSGIAFKLAWAMAESFSESKKVSTEFRNFLLTSLAYVAMGAVADVVPLRGENRILTRFGLTALRETQSPGMLALMDAAGLRDRRLRSTDVAFRIGPRLNAAGRMGHARETLELLMTSDTDRAREIARGIEKQNTQRKKMVESMTSEAKAQIEQQGLDQQPVILLSGEAWHAGVLGIVAARISDTYSKPCVIVAFEDGVGKGSARSIPAYPIQDALAACHDLLVSHGGHARAGGLQIERGKFPAFRERLLAHAANALREEDFVPTLDLDAEALLAQLSPEAIAELDMLEPFGEENPEPVLVATDLTVAGTPRFMGEKGNHISFFVRQGDFSLRAVAFDQASQLEKVVRNGARCSMAFTPSLNEFRGRTNVELRVRDLVLRPE